jgi:thiol-disulfide isomerase/thioredoxin
MRIALALLLFCVPRIVAAADRAPANAAHEVLPFIEDDYPRALAEARSRNVPLFVDSWATWCHTCRFMRAYVFSDPTLAKQAKRFVWLSIDTEKEQNAGFLGKYPVDVYPTLFVIDAAREVAVLRWPSSANPSELVKLLDDGERAAHGGGDAGVRERARADRLAGERKWTDAAAAYRMAIPLLPASERPRVVESLVGALAFAHEDAACGRAAQELVPTMPRGPSFANAVASGLGCALEVKGEEGATARAALTPLAEDAVALPGLLADDRSGLFEDLVQVRADANDAGGKHAVAQRWLAFLEAEAARAPGPEQRAVFDPHRVNAALAMDEPLRAEAALKLSERDLPGDYNAPARLALIYRAAKRYDDGLAAIDRALAKAYGPRALRLYDLKADLQRDKGDRAGAKKTLQQALTTAAGLPVEQRRPQLVVQLQRKLDSLR